MLVVRDDEELAAVEEFLEGVHEAADVRVVEGGVELVEHAERRGLDHEDREEERDGRHRALAAGEERDALRTLARGARDDVDAALQRILRVLQQDEARLVLLENAEDPLECGIDIIARPPGKRPQSVTLLSGGERTMTAVALLFAIFMIKPAPFCMLDELDAALDDANIGRFVDALKEFLDRSQFLIITHNQHTIAGSDLVYGVSQQEKGVSRIISMRLTDIGVKPVPEDTKQKKDQEH